MSLEENIEENIQLINKYDIFESRFGVFKILDYDLNLDERKLKFKKYDHVLCEDCNQEIEMFSLTSDYDLILKRRKAKYRNSKYVLCENCYEEVDYCRFYCTYCYDKEPDINKKVYMKFGPDFGIFKTSDYNLNLGLRRIKYMGYHGILCEECNQEINKYDFYYCTYCYDKETDVIKKGHMKFGPKFGIFKTFDYNLNLEERRAKYMNYDGILCEKCNNDIYKRNYYCTYCYNKETDVIKKGHMKFGLNLNFGIFNTFDYNLNLEERKAKFMNYDGILCEECNNKIDTQYYYCISCCYKETDVNKIVHMKFGSNFGIFNTFDYNLNLEERRAKYTNYNGILCEECNREINKYDDFYCTYCYDKETDVIKKGHMKFGSKFGIFNTFDYNLDLKERKAKYMNYDGILCEKCNKKINNYDYYCTYCYDKETNIIKKGHMKFGSKFGIFNTFDYNLDLKERKAKYMNYDGILCEKCNNDIYKRFYYCIYCYDKETDVNKKRHMKFGSNFKIFNTFDYTNLNLEERKAKYMNYDGILCEKCNNDIYKYDNFYCTYCYDKETDVIKKGHMKLGSKFGIFKTFDYNLNLEERKAKYMNYDVILCEKCNNDIYKRNYYCTYCYDKETDIIKKGHMKFGSKFGIFNTFDYNLNLEKRRAKYMNYDGILCEKCNKEINNHYYYCTYCYDKETNIIKKGHMKFGSKIGIFNIFDYNLDLKERKEKYKKYDHINHIVCEKCNFEIDKQYYYCTYCYNKETDVIKKNHMKLGSDFKIFNTFDYNLYLEERKEKYKKYDHINHIVCEKCNKEIDKQYYYCTYCYNKETDVIKKNYMKLGSDFKIFNTFDYNLNLEERRAKYEKYDLVICEKCDNEIDKQYYNCNYCYNNQMIINRCKICFIGNNDDCCSFYEFKQFLENFSKWINENNVVYKTLKVEISDYDLDEDDRREKYKNFDYILCEKCDRKYHYNYCYECFDEKIREFSPKLQDYENFYFKVYKKETNELRELKELQSILIDYKNIYFKLNKPINCPNQQEFISLRYSKRIRTGQVNTLHSDECSDCIIMDID
ncbi:hypothetical protein RhiirA1_388765 [Rhizophagus irregularis]|uniref:Uncharacterized protein n=1 Tax=Rhizophagus irregularis TaxID=588596 RepID=A0A2N0SDK3_9GLOM|nr:hypothetical protein RhiirA1_388765 [Rhizophagus irregularis]